MKRIIASLVLAALTTTLHAAPISGQGTWEATLLARDLDGDNATAEAYYDTELNITWLADANLAASNLFGLDPGFLLPNGSMYWSTTQNWFNAINNENYYGYNNWRLPSISPLNGFSYDYGFSSIGGTDNGHNISVAGTVYSGSMASELTHLFYNTLGNTGGYNPISGAYIGCSITCLTNTGLFLNLKSEVYFSGSSDPLDADRVWGVYFNDGYQTNYIKEQANIIAWAVHDGDIGTAIVPVPAAAWLFASGLIGLIGIAKREEKY